MRKTFTDSVRRYASLIHALECDGNHADGCGWFYGEIYRGAYFYPKAEEELVKFSETGITLDQLESFVLMKKPNRKDWIIK